MGLLLSISACAHYVPVIAMPTRPERPKIVSDLIDEAQFGADLKATDADLLDILEYLEKLEAISQ